MPTARPSLSATPPARRWLTRIVTRDANSVVTLDSSYSRDAAGRILAIDGLNARDDWTILPFKWLREFILELIDLINSSANADRSSHYDDLDQLASATNLGDPALSA